MKTVFGYIILFISILSISGFNSVSYAQENNTELVDPTEPAVDVNKLTLDDYKGLKLPPLSVLFDAAENNPRINFQRAKKEEEEGGLTKTKREWMTSLRAFGNYQYGQVVANAGTQTGSSTDKNGVTALQFSTQNQSLYNGGVALSLPLDILWDRKNRIRTQQARVKQSDYQIQQAIEELKIEISENYMNAMQQLNALSVRAEAVKIADSDIEMSKNSFLNGRLTIAEYNYRKTMQATAIANYETTKAELHKAILHLEILTNVKILKK